MTDHTNWTRPDLTAPPADRASRAPAQGDDGLRNAVRNMTVLLQSREWAEHLSTDPDAQALESEITALVGAAAPSAQAPTGEGAHCDLGVGCEETGVCYAEAHGEPDRCGRPKPQAATGAPDAPTDEAIAECLRLTMPKTKCSAGYLAFARTVLDRFSLAHAPADDVRRLVVEQAEDAGLWFIAKTAPEGYLQAALRKLHAAVEAAPADDVRAALEKAATIAAIHSQYPIQNEFDRGYDQARKDAAEAIRIEARRALYAQQEGK